MSRSSKACKKTIVHVSPKYNGKWEEKEQKKNSKHLYLHPFEYVKTEKTLFQAPR